MPEEENSELSSATGKRQAAFNNMDMQDSMVRNILIAKTENIEQQSTNNSDNVQDVISDIGA